MFSIIFFFVLLNLLFHFFKICCFIIGSFISLEHVSIKTPLLFHRLHRREHLAVCSKNLWSRFLVFQNLALSSQLNSICSLFRCLRQSSLLTFWHLYHKIIFWIVFFIWYIKQNSFLILLRWSLLIRCVNTFTFRELVQHLLLFGFFHRNMILSQNLYTCFSLLCSRHGIS